MSLITAIWRECRDEHWASGIRLWVDGWRDAQAWKLRLTRGGPSHRVKVAARRAQILAARVTTRLEAGGDSYLTGLSGYNRSPATVRRDRSNEPLPNTSMENWTVEQRARWWGQSGNAYANVANQQSQLASILQQSQQAALLNQMSMQNCDIRNNLLGYRL